MKTNEDEWNVVRYATSMASVHLLKKALLINVINSCVKTSLTVIALDRMIIGGRLIRKENVTQTNFNLNFLIDNDFGILYLVIYRIGGCLLKVDERLERTFG